MPNPPILPASQQPPSGMNAFDMVNYLASRVPGYDPSEYLREVNSAYIHVWEEISKLRVMYFANLTSVTIAKPQFTYDLAYNADGGLSAPVGSRFYQLLRLRVQPYQGGLFQATRAIPPMSPEFMQISANPTSTPTYTGPYFYWLYGKNLLYFGLPPAPGTLLEFLWTYWLISLGYLTVGTVTATNGSANIVGSGTNFTQIAPPDFQDALPAVGSSSPSPPYTNGEPANQCMICELEINGHTYRVQTITDDTHLTLVNPVAADDAGAAIPYVLASVPEIPREHLRVVATIALASMYTIAADDARADQWRAIAEKNIQMMKDSLMERQGQNPPQKIRFPYGLARRNRAFLR